MELLYSAIENDKESLYALIFIGIESLPLPLLKRSLRSILSLMQTDKKRLARWCLEHLGPLSALIMAKLNGGNDVSPKDQLLIKGMIHWFCLFFLALDNFRLYNMENQSDFLEELLKEGMDASYDYVNYKKPAKP